MINLNTYITEKFKISKDFKDTEFENSLEENIISIFRQFSNNKHVEKLVLDFLRERKWWNYVLYIHEDDYNKLNLDELPEKKVKTYKSKSTIDKEIKNPYGSGKNTFSSKEDNLFIDFREESSWSNTAIEVESNKLSHPILIRIREIPSWRYSQNNK